MSKLVNYKRSSDYVSEDFSDTVSEKSEISGRSTMTMFRTISLLKLSSEELSDPTHPVSIAMVKMRDITGIRIVEGKK